MNNWGTSANKQRELSKMLDEWYIITTHSISYESAAVPSSNMISLLILGLSTLEGSTGISHSRPLHILVKQSLSLNNMPNAVLQTKL